MFALGATLYYLLTGRVPPESPLRIANTAPLIPPRQINPAISPGTESAILSALELDVARRWPSVREFREALPSRPASTQPAEPPLPAAPVPILSTALPRVNVSLPAAPLRAWQSKWPVLGLVGIAGMCALLVIGGVMLRANSASITPAAPTEAAIVRPTTVLAITPPSETPQPSVTPASPPAFTMTPAPERSTPTPPFGIGATRVSNDGAVMVYVPAGEFTMGSSSDDSRASDNEKPQHTVYLDAFWMDKHEVTNALYKKCVDAGKCQAPSYPGPYTRSSYYGNSQFDNYPVFYVSWNDARAYCEWAGKRLPTEAQWEKSARGTNGRIYPWGHTFDKNLLNSRDGGPGDTTAVGSYPSGASPYGALDMAGNVWEWVRDWYDGAYYANSPRNNPTGPSSGKDKVVRGGSWNDDQNYVRAAARYYGTPDDRYYGFGLRCAQ